MQAPPSTQLPSSTDYRVKAFKVWWNVAFAEFLAKIHQYDARLFFLVECFSQFIQSNYQMRGVLESHLADLNQSVREELINDVDKTIFLQRTFEGKTIVDVVRSSGIHLEKYPDAARFLGLSMTVEPSEHHENPRHRGYFK